MNPNNILNYLSMVSNKNLIVNIMMHLAVIVSIVSVYLLKDAKVKKYIFNGTETRGRFSCLFYKWYNNEKADKTVPMFFD